MDEAAAMAKPAREQHLGEPQSPTEPEPPTLKAMCTCGHPRKEHRGLRIEVCGPCLECDCAAFSAASEGTESSETESPGTRSSETESPEQTIERIQAALARLERLRETVAEQIAQIDREAGPVAPPPPNGNGWHSTTRS